ncbi:MAG: agmatine deiminase [Desulfuromonas sp.]|uniref:agmatine deiminase family protein n=1 Tax=Desulfuromonas sp. TaxID=892 RepID=UPI000CC4B580|nr:agmatine deiminase family protein [Desulfuromonas sp.]PLX85702.1 MAG: agmatine deiminase [Desulfuromonas sp.]
MIKRLPAEWEEQDGILLAWPHPGSDWTPILHLVEPVFTEIARQAARFGKVLIVAHDASAVRAGLGSVGADHERVRILEIPNNDTWSRDFGPITILENGSPVLLDFGFNGWGLKFPADLDNLISRRLHAAGAFGAAPLRTTGLVLEGGSIDSDGKGTILTTSECLLGPNRNPHLDRGMIETRLREHFGADRVLWLENGYLAGDDTDAHVDTLARFAPGDAILHMACDDPEDEHFEPLRRMAAELERFRTPAGAPYRLLPLPWPKPRFDDEGQRLPATYANFLALNGAVLVPTYGDPADEAALKTIGLAFAGREIVGIDCSPLILQHGSLHCVTMQLPRGVLP